MTNRLALCIGINEYPRGYQLSGCVSDANSWGRFFSDIGFEVTRLTDNAATHRAMTGSIQRLVSRAQPGDIIAVQYSGHGTKVRADDSRAGDDVSAPKEGIVPVDFLTEGIIVDHTLGPIFDSAKPGVAINVFFDCCFSGDATRLLAAPPSLTRALDDPTVKERVLYLTEDMLKAHYDAEKRRESKSKGVSGTIVANPRMREVLFSASQPNQVSFESGGQGHFTRAAMSVVQNRNVSSLTNTTFIQETIAAMGSSVSFNPNTFDGAPLRSQTPQLQTNRDLLNSPFLGPIPTLGTPDTTLPSSTLNGTTREQIWQFLFGTTPPPLPLANPRSDAVTFDDLIDILNNASRAVRDAKSYE